MKITLNGESRETEARTLAELLAEIGLAEAKVATAVNEAFVAAPARATHALEAGDRIEVLAPMQGG
ncbi:sulfur carrier protein ThiS [Pseudoruegeria aquimaris]|uniref:Sulfur carrier protein ThiS n=1 Tax=Pseudoruegeria aquimaris TaxID=393663 RepID=A0A1Y5SAA8_9RHOB|nr:sulfur carrier protein ThiS [Pseudoruegeria aquimaris]SLN36129.1 sulfur carrier protein ThiS [Pseudoruegeria aquimaris]